MAENDYNDAVFDALLRKAVVENFERELSDISDSELALRYSFSERHENRMQQLFRRERAKHKLRQAVIVARRVAAVFVIAVALIFGLLMFDDGVRAEVKKVIIEWYDKFTSFQFTGEEQADTFEWRPTYIPDGFEEAELSRYGASTSIAYANTHGDEILFTYSAIQGELNLSADNEQREISIAMMGDQELYFFRALHSGIENGIIWLKDDYVFDLWSQLDIDELLKIVESIENIK